MLSVELYLQANYRAKLTIIYLNHAYRSLPQETWSSITDCRFTIVFTNQGQNKQCLIELTRFK